MNGKPNVVVILADDAGPGDIGCYNQESRIPTPNIDSLAQSGVRFTRAYAPGDVCTQTRYGLLTGRYHFRTSRQGKGVIFDYTDPIITDEPTIQGVLCEHGYRAYCSGKWHLGIDWSESGGGKGQFRNEAIAFDAPFDGPTACGFDRYYGIRASLDHPPYCLLEDGHVVGHPSKEKDTYYTQQRPGPASQTWDDRRVDRQFTQRALSYLTEAACADDPFFLYLPMSAPHRPCLPSSHVRGESDLNDRGDMIVQFDRSIGQIDAQLSALGVREETIVIVASDHGPQPSETDSNHDPTNGHRGQKATLYEGGIRVPLVVNWPEELTREQIDTPVSLVDLFPTICDIIGYDIEGLDGQSLVPLLNGRDQPSRPIVSEDGSGQLTILHDDWKYIEAAGDRDAQLYNLSVDPQESNNRILDKESVADSLQNRLEELR